jgi:putative (di)nucleoside polyphosphate hydrolase
MALTELARFLPRSHHHNRYLRAGVRPHRHDENDSAPPRTAPIDKAPAAARLMASVVLPLKDEPG